MFQDIVCFFCQLCVWGIQILQRLRYVIAFETMYGKKQTYFYFQILSHRDGMYSKFPLLFLLQIMLLLMCSMYVCWKPSWSYVVFVLGSVAQLGRTRELVCCICSGVRPVRRGSCCCRRTSFVGDWKDERNKKKTDVLTALNIKKKLTRSQGQCMAPTVILSNWSNNSGNGSYIQFVTTAVTAAIFNFLL